MNALGFKWPNRTDMVTASMPLTRAIVVEMNRPHCTGQRLVRNGKCAADSYRGTDGRGQRKEQTDQKQKRQSNA